tara:strand:+ start:5513 stop:5725 length:213 start_codon:yes stop_codon:yes gene_type:complete
MIREKTYEVAVIDLSGPQGNAYYLLSQAQILSKFLGLDSTEVCEEMRNGDYEHLIQTFDKYFGEYVILER